MASESDREVRVRFAPSPTGYLHVGSARTALFNWLFARRTGGRYLLRIEDTDELRNRQDWAEGIVTTLAWLGLSPDEPPVYQSSRAGEHEKAIDALWEGRFVYACECTREQVIERTKHNAIPGYDGFCRDKKVEREGNALRFRVPDDGTVTVHDVIRGDVEFQVGAIEDFVVVKSNGAPLFVLANVSDDRAMGITHAIRGEDLLPSAPKGLLIWEALDTLAGSGRDVGDGSDGSVAVPSYAHLPMLVNESGKKISKRRDDVAVESYRAQGFVPGAFVNYLSLLGWAYPDGREIFDISDAAEEFSLESVHHGPAFFDVAKLRHVNGEHLRAMSEEEFVSACVPFVEGEAEALRRPVFEAVVPGGPPWPREHFDAGVFRRIAPHVQQRVSTLSEVPPMVEFLFFEQPVIDAKDWESVAKDESSPAILDAAIAAYESCEFDPESLHEVTAGIAETVGKKLAKAQAPIRVAVTGRRVGPPLFESISILGRSRTLERLRSARAHLEPAS